MDKVLRALEQVVFCLLSALCLFWIGDRLRGVDFEPIPVVICAPDACLPYAGPSEGRPLAEVSRALDPRGVLSFSNFNMCTRLAQTLELRGESEQGVDQIIDLLTSRGTLRVIRPEGAPLEIHPGARNDGVFDVIRDALSLRTARGCFPINYGPVFWPLWFVWCLLVFARLFRGQQQEWARR